MFPAGRARHRITIQEPTVVQDEHGQDVATWVTLITSRAVITPAPGAEVFTQDQTLHTVPTRFEVRYRDTIMREDLRIEWRGEFYKILSVINVGENRRIIHFDTVKIREVSAE